jgi:hypothetical protein
VTGVLPEHSVPPGKVFWNCSRFSRFGKDEQATPTLFAVDSIIFCNSFIPTSPEYNNSLYFLSKFSSSGSWPEISVVKISEYGLGGAIDTKWEFSLADFVLIGIRDNIIINKNNLFFKIIYPP